MRIIAEIPHPQCKISVFYMNGKYIVQFAVGPYEQSFKWSEVDYAIKNVEDIIKIINQDFINEVLNRFKNMHQQTNTRMHDLNF